MSNSADLDVDVRFLLANERTLLAWVRTSLTLLAAGVGTRQLVDEPWALGPALGLLALGALASGAGLVRHRRADQALRQGRLPATGATPALVAGTVAVVALALTALTAASALP